MLPYIPVLNIENAEPVFTSTSAMGISPITVIVNTCDTPLPAEATAFDELTAFA